MQATKQQQIMGFFIEEAKEHLDTIEQGLLDLKTMLSDPEQQNELFRAAHSIKGGAAMLGFDSIHRVAHHLEDYFKILKDNPVRPDRHLEDLFLKGFDTLKELVEALQSPYGLQEEQAEQMVQSAQPTFLELHNYLHQLIQQGAAQPPAQLRPDTPALLNAALRKMLTLFKQEDNPGSRQQLGHLCQQLGQLADCTEWRMLVQISQRAITNSKNSYQTLAPLVIKELKQAGDLLVAGKSKEIAPSRSLQKTAGIAVLPTTVQPLVQPLAAIAPPATPAPEMPVSGPRSQQIAIPLEPRAAARVLLEAFNKQQLIELAEFLMKAIQ